MKNNSFFSIVMLVSGVSLCLCSCALSCDFFKMSVSTPKDASNWDMLIFFIKCYVGGIGITAAQSIGKVALRATGNLMFSLIYWLATAVSVFISVCVFYSSFASNAIELERINTEYNALIEERKQLNEKIAATEKNKNEALRVYLDEKLVSKGLAMLDKTIVRELEGDKKRLAGVKKEIALFMGNEGGLITARLIYRQIADDFTGFLGFLPGWFSGKMVFIFTWVLLLVPALLIDLTGSNLLDAGVANLGLIPVLEEEQHRFAPIYSTSVNSGTDLTPQPEPEPEKPWHSYSQPKNNNTNTESWGRPEKSERIEVYRNEEHRLAPVHSTGANSDVSSADFASYQPQPLDPELKTVDEPAHEMSEIESQRIAAYKEKGTYNGALKFMGVGKGTESLQALKNTLDKFGIPHGRNGSRKGSH